MNTELKITWESKPIDVDVQSPEKQVFRIPLGVLVTDPNISVPVRSVNSKVGDVQLGPQDVGADPAGSANTALIQSKAYTDTNIQDLDSQLRTFFPTLLQGLATEAYVDGKLQNVVTTVNFEEFKTELSEDLTSKADLVDGVIPASQLPSYVDDVIEFPSLSNFPQVGESGKIYVASNTNKTYRWSGSSYVPLDEGVALGETSATAYRGDRGALAYQHTNITGNPHNSTTTDIPEGANQYFTNSRVLSTPLAGLTSGLNTKILETDSVIQALAKLQAQISAFSGGSESQVWVDATTVATLGTNVSQATLNGFQPKLELSRYQGYLWIRGSFVSTGSLSFNAPILTMNSVNYKIQSGSLNSEALALAPLIISRGDAGGGRETIFAQFTVKGTATNTTNGATSVQSIMLQATSSNSNSTYVIAETKLGKLLVP